MITFSYDHIEYAVEMIRNEWGDEVSKQVFAAIFNADTHKMEMEEFLKECTCCGGNWGGMLLSGVRRLYPEVWDAIPDNMGVNAWACICAVLTLCKIGVME